MNFKNMIEQKLIELEGGKFQLLCNDLLEHLNFGLVTNYGGQNGTNKVIKGTPDSYILNNNGKYIFIEYTTQQSNVYKKLKADIEKCLDENKTEVPVNQIEKIIIMYNSTISPGELMKLRDLCINRNVMFENFDINNITHNINGLFPLLATEYLGISISNGQFLDYKTFISMNDKTMLSTPLGISIHGRKDNIIEIIKIIDNYDFVIVKGKTGIGKTKFVCEALKQYRNSRKDTTIWFIKDKGKGLYEDLLKYTTIGKHLIFVDDINKQTNITDLLEYYCENRDRIKIISTVREYALESVLKNISNYVESEIYEIRTLDDETIVEIIKEDFEIFNPVYHNQIIKLANGNVRLAVMMAIVAKKENSLDSIKNIGNILEKYYKSIKENLESIEDVSYLKALGALSFIDKLNLNSSDLMNIISKITEIPTNRLIEIYKKLHYEEIVDLYENEIVTIPDQIVSVFVFHYVYEERKLLDYTTLLELFFPTYKNRIIQNVNGVISYYNNIDFFSNSVKDIWELWQKEGDIRLNDLVLTFWFVKPEDTLIYISDEISNIKPVITKKDIEIINGSENKDDLLRTLGSFSNTNNSKLAIEITLNFLDKDPTMIVKIAEMLIHNFGYSINSLKQGYFIQKELIDSIIARMFEDKEIFINLFCNLSKHLLSYNVEWNDFNNKEFVIHTIKLDVSGKMKEIRTTILNKCVLLINDGKHEDVVINILSELNSYNSFSVDKELQKFDYLLLSEDLIHLINLNNTKNLLIIYKLDIYYKKNIHKGFEQIKVLKEYQIIKIFKDESYNYDENLNIGEQIFEQNQLNFAKKLETSDYRLFIETCSNINQVDNNNYKNSEIFLRILFNVGSFIDMLELYIEFNTPFNNNALSIIKQLIKTIGYENSFKFILKYNFSQKEYWEYLLYSLVDETSISKELSINLINYFNNNNSTSVGYLRDLDFLENFNRYDINIYIHVLKIIFNKKDEFLKQMYLTRLFIDEEKLDKFIIKFNGNFKLLEDIYLYCLEKYKIYDPNGNICKKILLINPKLIYKIIDVLCDNREYQNYSSYFNYNIIWEYEVDEIIIFIEYIFNTYANSCFGSEIDRFFININIEKNDDKIEQVINKFIEKNSSSKKSMTKLFFIISEFNVENQIKYYIKFLKVNNNIEAFKELPFRKRMESFDGSRVPSLIKKIEFIKKLNNQITDVKLLKHKKFLVDLIEYYEKTVKKVKISEFLHDY